MQAIAAPSIAQPVPTQFRGGGAQTGVTETVGVDELGGLAWRFRTDGPVRSSPTVAGGVVYFGSTDGMLYAVDAATGSEVWRHDAGSPVGGAPLVTNERVVFTDRANRVHAVDRRAGLALWRVDTGADLPLRWGHEGWDYLLPSAALADSTVLVGSGDGYLYAFDLRDGSERWRFETGGRIRATPAVQDGIAYIGSGDGIVYGVALADGREVWRFTTRGVDLDAADYGFDRTQIQASPAIADGALYVGSRDASLYALPLDARPPLAPRWTIEDGSAWVVASPAVHEGSVYSARSSSGNVRALDAATGTERWVHQTGGPVFASPVVVGETVYVASHGGRVWALAASDGAVRWSYVLGAGSVSTPAAHDGHLYVGSDDGYLYALQRAEGMASRRAVFWDDGMTEHAVLGSQEAHRTIADHFERFGYERLDTAGLRSFLEDRVGDGAPSVIVFAMDALPASVAPPDADAAAEAPLLVRYLRRGGKVVWLGHPPLLLARDPGADAPSIDRARPGRLLGVDHFEWNADVYGVAPTAAGRRWGLETSWVGRPMVAATEPVTVLATDELGRAAAWVRTYGGAPGSGFVMLRASVEDRVLEEIRHVAEFGVFRLFPG